MSKDRPRRGGLAARFLQLTMVIGITTVVAAGSVAMFSIYRLSASATLEADRTLAHLIENRIESRASSVNRTMDRAAAVVSEANAHDAMVHELGGVFEGAGDEVRGIYVADSVGVPIASVPLPSADTSCYATVFTRSVQGRAGFVSIEACGVGGWDLWLSRTVLTPSGEPVVVMFDVDTSFLTTVLDEAVRSEPDRSVLFVSDGSIIASAGADPPRDLGQVVWYKQESGSGLVTMPQGAKVLHGVYNDLLVPEGATWKVLVVESQQAGMRATLDAATPPFLVLAVGGLVAVVAAWTATRRLAGPLTDLEHSARAAASGAYVQPLSSEGDDEIARVADAFNAVALRLNALHDLSQLLASAARFDQVIDGILASMGHLVGPGKAVAYLLDADGEALVPVRAKGVELASLTSIRVTSGGWLDRVLSDAELAEIDDEPAVVVRELPSLATGERCAVAAPLVAGHAPLGVVIVLKQSGEPLTEAEREMLRTFSAQAAVAVQTSRLFEIESRSRMIAESLRAVAEELVATDGLSAAIERVETIVKQLFGDERVRILLKDRDVLGLPPADDGAGDAELFDAALRLLVERAMPESLVVESAEGPHAREILERLGAEQAIVVGVAPESDHGAMLAIGLSGQIVTEPDVDLAASVADVVGLALDKAYLFERALERATNLETIFRISQVVGSPLQVNVVLNRVLDVVQKLLSADGVALVTYDARRRTLSTSMARGKVPVDLVTGDFSPGEDIPGLVFDATEPVILRNLDTDNSGLLSHAAEIGLRSLVAVPLLARSRATGVLLVFSATAGSFTEEDVNLLQTFASQAALAIDTARLYSREHEVASVLQEAILPEKLQHFPEIDAGSIYEPVGSENEIGGDYYDLFRGPDGAIWLVIADVCGKGIHAATKTSMIKHTIRALVAAGLGPAEAMRELNRLIAESGAVSDIVTAWMGRYEPARGRIVYANAGHPPALMKRADGSTARLDPTGPLLGAMADIDYDLGESEFGKGDRIVLYTDGVTEARHGNTFFGEERLWAAFRTDGTAVECTQIILEEVRAFARGPLRDDVAILCVSALDHDTHTDGMKEA